MHVGAKGHFHLPVKFSVILKLLKNFYQKIFVEYFLNNAYPLTTSRDLTNKFSKCVGYIFEGKKSKMRIWKEIEQNI